MPPVQRLGAAGRTVSSRSPTIPVTSQGDGALAGKERESTAWPPLESARHGVRRQAAWPQCETGHTTRLGQGAAPCSRMPSQQLAGLTHRKVRAWAQLKHVVGDPPANTITGTPRGPELQVTSSSQPYRTRLLHRFCVLASTRLPASCHCFRSHTRR